MKKTILLLILILTGSVGIYSQVPQAMTYKAIAKDDWGISLPSKAVTLRFTILEGSGFGVPVYMEVHSTVTNKFGLMDVQIGKGIAKQGNFSNINWKTGIYYIKIEMDPKGGSDFRLEDPAHQLLAVPYALYAGSSGDAFSGNYNDLYNRPTNLSQFNNNLGFITNESDPSFSIHPAHEISNANISNWNTAFLWGNHAGLYKPLNYIPAWAEVIGNPFSITSPVADQLLKYNVVSSKWENWTPSYLVSEVDGSITNEIQTLSIEGDVISLTNGGSVKLPSVPVISGQYYYADKDNDGFGDRFTPVWVPTGVSEPANFILSSNDCNDNDPVIHPGTTEICGDGIDQDCNGTDLICGPDSDSDGVLDSKDNCPYVSNPGQEDSDGDGIGDVCDNSGSTCFPESTEPIIMMIRLINEERVKNHVVPLAPDPRIMAAAQGHSEFMSSTNTISHTGKDGSTFMTRMAAEGYSMPRGEILFYDNSTLDPTVAVTAWLNSPPHKEVMMMSIHRHIGIGYKSGYWTVDFGGATDGPTCTNTEIDKDGDGFKVSQGDCDDNNPQIFPGASELMDGLDNDCNGSLIPQEMDADGDGFVIGTIDQGGWHGNPSVTGGGDCNDNDPTIHPGAFEVIGDGIDQDCRDGDQTNVPSSFDWRNVNGQNWLTTVKNQGSCGSCYAVATVAAFEAKIKIQSNNPSLVIDLSEQEIVSCSTSPNNGCNGGLPGEVLNYIRDKGIVEESVFPYLSGNGSVPACSSFTGQKKYKIDGWEYLTSMDPNEIKKALINKGPVIFATNVYLDFYQYNGGIYIPNTNLSSPGSKANLLIGYNDAEEYWIIENTWGKTWGESGYYKLGYAATATIGSKCVINNAVDY